MNCHRLKRKAEDIILGGSKQNIPPDNMRYLRNQWSDLKKIIEAA